jgi:hypothetical protein
MEKASNGTQSLPLGYHSEIETKKVMKLALAVVLVMLAVGATAVIGFLRHTTVLEWKDVFQSQLTEVQSSGQPAIRVSGLCGQSALSVKDITVQRDGPAELVTVRVSLARRGTSGTFQVDVPVRDDINEIRFGQQKIVIWQRHPK